MLGEFNAARNQDEAEVEAKRLVGEQGYTMLPPFDHPHIIIQADEE